MNTDHLIRYYGSVSKIAKALDINRQSVYVWFRNKKIPMFRQLQIEKLTNKHLIADFDNFDYVEKKAHQNEMFYV